MNGSRTALAVLSTAALVAGAVLVREANRGPESALVSRANLAALRPAVLAYTAEKGGFAGMRIEGPGGLRQLYGRDLPRAPAVTVLATTASTFCVRSSAGDAVYYSRVPSMLPTRSPCGGGGYSSTQEPGTGVTVVPLDEPG